jgi:type VI secretion system secreted protein Hcp
MPAQQRSPGVDVKRAAPPIALFLTANGTPITGDSTMEATEDAIECVSLVSGVRATLREGSGMASGRRTHDGIWIRKAIDRSSPLLAKALCQNEMVEGVFKFFRPSPTGDGTTEQFFTIEFENGRVAEYEVVSPDGYADGSDPTPPVPAFEDVKFVYATITWRYENAGIEHTDTWSSKV